MEHQKDVLEQYHLQQCKRCDRILKNLDNIDMNTQLENMGFFR